MLFKLLAYVAVYFLRVMTMQMETIGTMEPTLLITAVQDKLG